MIFGQMRGISVFNHSLYWVPQPLCTAPYHLVTLIINTEKQKKCARTVIFGQMSGNTVFNHSLYWVPQPPCTAPYHLVTLIINTEKLKK